MAKLTFDDVTRMCHAMDRKVTLTDAMTTDMLLSMGTVYEKEQKESAEKELQGQYYKGYIKDSIKRDDSVEGSGRKKSIMIKPAGVVVDEHHRRGTRVAEIAYINEYGKTNQPARPFMRLANEKADPKSLAAAVDVVDRYMNQD